MRGCYHETGTVQSHCNRRHLKRNTLSTDHPQRPLLRRLHLRQSLIFGLNRFHLILLHRMCTYLILDQRVKMLSNCQHLRAQSNILKMMRLEAASLVPVTNGSSSDNNSNTRSRSRCNSHLSYQKRISQRSKP